MNEFQYIQKALEVIIDKDDYFAAFKPLTVLGGNEAYNGKEKYSNIEKCISEFEAKLLELDDLQVGDEKHRISLPILIKQLNSSGKEKAKDLITRYKQQITTALNLKCALKNKDVSIGGMTIIVKARSLVHALFEANTRAYLLQALYDLSNMENGFNLIIYYIQGSPNSAFLIYSLLIPDEILEQHNKNTEKFTTGLIKDFERSKIKISPLFKKLKYSNYFFYELVYYIYNYVKDKQRANEILHKINLAQKAEEKFFIVSRNIYEHFPIKEEKGGIRDKLRKVLNNSKSLNQKSSDHFKLLDKIKEKAEKASKLKSTTIKVNLHQSIILMKLNICVSILQRVSDDLSKIDPSIMERVKLPAMKTVNPDKIPYYLQWEAAYMGFMKSLKKQTEPFKCLIYHKIMSAVLGQYDDLSKIYDNIFVETEYDQIGLRNVIEDKAKLIASIQTNPMLCIEGICQKEKMSEENTQLTVELFSKFTPAIIPTTANCFEQFIYSAPSVSDQYQLTKRKTNNHPLYPLVTIYTEWYKQRAFIQFFESFGNDVSSYCRGFESIKGAQFEMVYRDFVYLNYLYGKVYKTLTQQSQNLILKLMTLFSIAPNDSNYYLVLKKYALIEAALSAESDFMPQFTSFVQCAINENEEGKLNISTKFYDFLKLRKLRKTFLFALSEIGAKTCTLSYCNDQSAAFKIYTSIPEWEEVNEEIIQIRELGGGNALAALGFLVIMKEYASYFVHEAVAEIDYFPGFYTAEIFNIQRTVKMSGDPNRKIFDLDDDYAKLENAASILDKYKKKDDIKSNAVHGARLRLLSIKNAFDGNNKGFDLDKLNQHIGVVKTDLANSSITKAFGTSNAKTHLETAMNILKPLQFKLRCIDIAIFAQNELSVLKPYDANRKFIDLLANFLAKTFVKNEEVTVIRSQDFHKALEFKSMYAIEGKNSTSDTNQNNETLSLVKFDTESASKEMMILGAYQEEQTGKLVVPRNTDNKFYIFLRIIVQMCEYYMDTIIDVFKEKYDKHDKQRFDKFLDKLITDFQLAIDTEFKTKILDSTVKKLKKVNELLKNFVLFTSLEKIDSQDNEDDFKRLSIFIQETLNYLEIRSFDRIKFYDTSYKAFTLIDRFNKSYSDLTKLYSTMKENDGFIILSITDLCEVYGVKNENELVRLSKNEGDIAKSAKLLLDSPETCIFELFSLKQNVDNYYEFVSRHVINPEYDENVILMSSVFSYEYNQLIMILFDDFVQNEVNYQGQFKWKWWHFATLFFGAGIDYAYTTNNYANGIKKIYSTIKEEKLSIQEKIETIQQIARRRMQFQSKRKGDVQNVYEFLASDLNDYIKDISKWQAGKKIYNFNLGKPGLKRTGSCSDLNSLFKSKSFTSHHSRKTDSNDFNSDIKGKNHEGGNGINNHPLNKLQLINQISGNLQILRLITPDMAVSQARDIIDDYQSHTVGRADFLSNGFVDICVSKIFSSSIINLGERKFNIIPCRTVTSAEINNEGILADIRGLINSNADSLIFVPVNLGNWHFVASVFDTRSRNAYFFDSYGNSNLIWFKRNLQTKTVSNYNVTAFVNNFQMNNDCGFLVVELFSQLVFRNNFDMNFSELYSEIQRNYDSNFLRLHYIHFAGEPYSANQWLFNDVYRTTVI